jgi:DNA (cytosine-5)-methyltransferase 1
VNELALFAGAGGGLLASTHLLGWDTVCGVEINEYARSVLLARQRDGFLPFFPVWDDICTFDGRPWRGLIDVVSGGFPCQAFSTAARGRNNAVDLWPEMLRIIHEVRPIWVFAENVQAKPIERAAAQLADIGYDGRWCKLSAADVGAPHLRARYWLAAHSNTGGQPRRAEYAEASVAPTTEGLEWWRDDAQALGVHDGMADRVERMRALGNGQVPAVAAVAWEVLSSCLA